LLANENYERLEAAGVSVSLITGEERKLHPNATHYASTVEMLDPHRPIDMAVIDEVQMLDDNERGTAWNCSHLRRTRAARSICSEARALSRPCMRSPIGWDCH
jgi:hypothetical protein